MSNYETYGHIYHIVAKDLREIAFYGMLIHVPRRDDCDFHGFRFDGHLFRRSSNKVIDQYMPGDVRKSTVECLLVRFFLHFFLSFAVGRSSRKVARVSASTDRPPVAPRARLGMHVALAG